MRWLILSLLALLSACAAPRPHVAVLAGPPPLTILVSIDGFRPDYLHKGLTPTLDRLADTGVSAAMRPSFPTKTFPNHYALVTGLRPDRNGIVGNKMEDPARPGELFTMATKDAYWWQQSEPIWITAERAGIPTATLFWPGSEVALGNVRPHDWLPYDKAEPGRMRVDQLLAWLRRPLAARPGFATLYFDVVDENTHHHGIGSAEGIAAIREVDGNVGYLTAELARSGIAANLVIVSDHGMAPSGPDRVVMLDTLANPADYRVIEDGANVSLYPRPGHEAALERALVGRHDHVTCWKHDALPARFHFGHNPRVAAIFCLPDEGWLVFATMPKAVDVGSHGYDNALRSMRATFIANGPAFKQGKRLPLFDNVDVYPLLRDLIGLPVAEDVDGTDAPFRKVLNR
ncbi:ectonucleotide pyrophosphatase/phosphodiesterase [uncultured Sphingomonas sp.]|uniref:alkaline phosphatase family protein n=1 Tax=uncultured Sphingomonas sp. TaxID=158754 RepID=UPI0025F1194D|nr:ectonucleotide pyrophosphatase/phosphodiesterase [uncultured Sphingomonas sp.]